MNSNYFKKEAKKEFEELYHRKLNELPIRYEFMNIETTYGDTNIVITGQPDKVPLVLLHGYDGGLPVAIEVMIELADHFRIYTVNIPGLSDECGLNSNDNSYGQWMYEILSRLGIRNVFLVGISLGGFVAIKFLAFDEKRVAKAFLISPAVIVKGNVVQNLQDIPLIYVDEAGRIKTPLHIFVAENDEISNRETLQEQARKIFPSLNRIILVKGSKHIPAESDIKKIAEIIRNNIGL